MNRPVFGWKQDYALGIEDIDFQHRCFLNLINRLADELTMTTEPRRRAALMAEVNAYAHFHFLSEENLMAKVGYPQLDEHRQRHRDLIGQLNAKEAMLQQQGTEERADEVVEFLRDWFFRHTVGEDRLFADYYHGHAPDR